MASPSLHNTPTLFLLFAVICFITFYQSGVAHLVRELDVSKKDLTYDSALTLISVEREPTSEGNKFTVRYTKNAEDLIFRVQDNMGAPRSPTVVEEANGIWAASFVMQSPAIPQWFIIGDHDFQHMVAINLDNSDTTPAQQDIVELPVIHVTPASEAVYVPTQEDVVITAFVPRNSQTGLVVDNFGKTFSALDLDTMEVYEDLDDDSLFTLGQPQELPDRIQASMTIHTSSRNVSGYLQLRTVEYNTGGALAQLIQVSRSILVRPSTQSGPYPTGFLAFLDMYATDTSPNGNELHRCRAGDECLLHCSGIGSSISGIEVNEVQTDGSLRGVPSAQEDVDILDTHRAIYWKFQAGEDSGDGNGVTTFQCKARDATHDKEVSKLVDVQVEIEGTIDQSRSTVVVADHPMDPTLKTVTFQCAVRGNPFPDVAFFGGSTYVFRNLNIPDTVTFTGQNEALATSVITVDACELDQAIQRISEGLETSPSCNIYSNRMGNYTSHNFYPRLCK